jgi:hypothetical protein
LVSDALISLRGREAQRGVFLLVSSLKGGLSLLDIPQKVPLSQACLAPVDHLLERLQPPTLHVENLLVCALLKFEEATVNVLKETSGHILVLQLQLLDHVCLLVKLVSGVL